MGIYSGWDHLETEFLFELIDSAEFNALSTAQKDYLRIMLSCGRINFRPNRVARNLFLSYFPIGTTTHQNWLVALATLEPVIP